MLAQIFQYPLPDRSLCYQCRKEDNNGKNKLSGSSAGSFPLLLRLSRKSRRSYALSLSVSSAGSFPLLRIGVFGAGMRGVAFSILCRIVPSATPCAIMSIAIVGSVFQYPLPDRSLCYDEPEFPPSMAEAFFQDPLPDRSLCYPVRVKGYPLQP